MDSARISIAFVGILVILAALAGPPAGGQEADTRVSFESSPTDYEAAEATHSAGFSVETGAPSVGEQFDDVLIDYEPGELPADVSNVDADAIQWIGIDRGGDNTGTRIDEAATVVEVSDQHDGQALLVETAGELTLEAGDQVIVVYQSVQNPQDQSQSTNSDVTVTLNIDGSADEATGTVRYEWNTATVSMADQETGGETVTVEGVTLSENGFVVVQNEQGRSSDEIRGATYLEAGEHENVEVKLDPAVSSDTELHAQVYLDTNGDHRFEYDGALVDRPFVTKDGNIMATDSAEISHTDDGSTDTPTGTETAAETTPTETEASASTQTAGDEETATAADDTPEGTDAATEETETEDGGMGGETDDGEEADTDTEADANADGPGFGVLGGVAALVAALVLARRA